MGHKPKIISLGKYLLRTALITGIGASLIGYLLYKLIGTRSEDLWIAIGLACGMGVLLGVTISLLNYRRFIAPMKTIILSIDQVVDGNFEIQMNLTKVGELKPVANSLNELVKHWGHLIQGLQKGLRQISEFSALLAEATSQNREAATQIATTTEELNQYASNQQREISQGSQAVDDTKSSIKELVRVSIQVLDSANKTVQTSQEGTHTIARTTHQLEESKRSFASLDHTINELAVHSSRVSEVTSMIGAIAEQTNLLALNAAIEAARAGEHGKGFAVVADEVRKLADESRRSSIQIETIIAGILEEIEMAKQKITDSSTHLERGVETMKETSTSFIDINRDVTSILNHLTRLKEVEKNVVQSSEQIEHTFSFIEQASTTTTQRLELFSAAVEEQLASMQSIDQSIEALHTMSKELNVSVADLQKK